MRKNDKLAGTLLVGILIGALLAWVVVDYRLENRTEDEYRKKFYMVEAATAVSPHHIRKHIKEDSFILIDLRSQEEYEVEHIIGAVNIPAYKDKDHSDYGAVERISSSFRKLEEDNPGKDLIVYCYSIPCMTGRKVGKILAERGIYVKHLGVGWNEWRYHWELWNHPHEWNQTNVEDFIYSGPEPGVVPGKVEQFGAACGPGVLGC